MKPKIEDEKIPNISIIISVLIIIGIGVYLYFQYEIIGEIFSGIMGVIMFIFFFDALGRITFGNIAMKFKPSLIFLFFRKDNLDKGGYQVTKNHFFGRANLVLENYELAEKYLYRSAEVYYYKTIIKDFDEEKKQVEREKKIDSFYKQNQLLAFFKANWLYISEFIEQQQDTTDTFYLNQDVLLYLVKIRKVCYPNDSFLADFDEEKKCFKENLGENNISEGLPYAKHRNAFSKNIDLLCVESKLLLEFSNEKYYHAVIDNCNEALKLVKEDEKNYYRFLYVRGCAYHKLGDADLACQDWKRGVELGDLEFSQKMYNENCKE